MKKILILSLIGTLILHLILLSRYLIIEEILGLYIIPILLILLIASLSYPIIRLFKAVRYQKLLVNFLIVSCILQVAILSLILWSASPRFFSRNEVISDIDFAINLGEDIHPDLYDAISKEAFLLRTDSIKRSLPEKVSDVLANQTFRKIFSAIKDGHTGGGWNFYSHRGSVAFRKMLPYKIEVRNDRIYVTKSYFYRNSIPVGSEIIEINGKQTSQCIKEVSQLLSYENIPFRNSLLQNPLIWGLWNNFKSFEITYTTPDTRKTRTIKTSGGLVSKMLFMKDLGTTGKDYSYKTLADNVGYIEFNSFNDLDKFKIFLDSTFRIVKENDIHDLIIDIRKNSGGSSSLGDELMQYISKTDFSIFDSMTVKISAELSSKNYFNWIEPSLREIGSVYTPGGNHLTKLRNNPLRYNGNSYLLVSGSTFSSATCFASAFQCYNAGKIIGAETGGLTVCFGDQHTVILPNTKFDIGVSYKKFYNACGIDNKRGIIPDFEVENSLEDEQQGIDRVLKFTIDLINQRMVAASYGAYDDV